jgi:hypothetical protein
MILITKHKVKPSFDIVMKSVINSFSGTSGARLVCALIQEPIVEEDNTLLIIIIVVIVLIILLVLLTILICYCIKKYDNLEVVNLNVVLQKQIDPFIVQFVIILTINLLILT